ncbi:ABC transporter ATP-binding protein [Marinilabiliaceae bacterium JC017]|nr:ABC transporter ATP-binding protein [Marinilabiliaceae bacterium JC017]
MLKPVIQAHNLSITLDGKQILKHISTAVLPGQFYAILGPNGSGKSTFLKSISGLLPIGSGTVMHGGTDLLRLSAKELAKNQALVPQNNGMSFDFSAYEVVMMGRTPHMSRFYGPAREDKKRVEEAMLKTGIWSLRRQSVRTMSGGEKQRVAIARALVQDTLVILLDEPVSQLDLYHQISILSLLKELCEKRKKTVVTVIHDINQVMEYADRVIVFKEGRLVANGATDKVISSALIRKVFDVNMERMINDNTGKPFFISAPQSEVQVAGLV